MANIEHYLAARPPRKVVASGYFSPLHAGHVAYLQAAARLGVLTVIVNNDRQAELKGSVPFMAESERLEVVRALGCVSRAVLSVDEGRSVERTLRLMHELCGVDVFANGGDVSDCLEAGLCAGLGIEAVYGVGGSAKVQSSSELIRRAVAFVNGKA